MERQFLQLDIKLGIRRAIFFENGVFFVNLVNFVKDVQQISKIFDF